MKIRIGLMEVNSEGKLVPPRLDNAHSHVEVVEKSEFDKVLKALTWALDHMEPPFVWAKYMEVNKMVKNYRGEE